MTNTHYIDTIILGAGAAGMMCASQIQSGTIAILDHAKKPGEKIRISGGGRCNFTNRHCGPNNFLSNNPHFAKSALAAYSPQDFIALVERHGITHHEKTLGQLFCDDSAKKIIQMLRDEMAAAGAQLHLETKIEQVAFRDARFHIDTSMGQFIAHNLVVATGGKSIPKMGATSFGYELAQQFGHTIIAPRPALVPFTWPAHMAEEWKALSGVALPIIASHGKTAFEEAMLMTHRGLSGPAILQISSYWREGESVALNLLPHQDVMATLKALRESHSKSAPATALAELLPKRLAQQLISLADITTPRMGDMGNKALETIGQWLSAFPFTPGGTEGYRTAEVTLGGVDTQGLNQKTMESRQQSGLYFIGEVVDVTGHLGGHNFQWAWASAVAAGRAIKTGFQAL